MTETNKIIIFLFVFALFAYIFSALPANAATPVPNTVSINEIWTAANSPYIVDGNIYYRFGTLTIEPGTVVKFANASSSLDIHADVDVKINGATDTPVYFTSIKDDSIGGDTNEDANATSPSAGDWGYVSIGGGAYNRGLNINYLKVRYGGSSAWGSVSPALILIFNWYYGFPTQDYYLKNVEVSNSTTGLYVYVGGNHRVYISDSSFHDNSDYGMYANLNYPYATTKVSAINNWWGDMSGPYHPSLNPLGTGDRISDNINFIPWLEYDPTKPRPSLSELKQLKSDGLTEIEESGISTEDIITFQAKVNSPSNNQVKLQIEVKKTDQDFDESGIIESAFVTPDSFATAVASSFTDGNYKWRARAVDSTGFPSDWQEFGIEGNVDFEIKLVPLYTQIRSPYPSWDETEEWFDNIYGSGNYNCKNPISQISDISSCGCAITSMVMLGRYYSIDVGIDSTNVDPVNINTWLTNDKGYTKDGRLYWSKGIEYLGFVEDGVKKVRLTLDYYNEPFGSLRIDNSLELAKPVIAYSKKFSHYFVVDNKLTTTYGLKDPAWYNTQTLNDTENLVNKIRGYNNYFDQANIFTYLETPKKITGQIYLYLASPAELLITDPLNRRLGKDPINNIIYNEIPDSSYTREGSIITSETPLTELPEAKVIYIPTPIDGKYDIQAIGTESGSYTMGLLAYDETGQSKVTTQTGSTTINNIQEFELNYSTSTIQQVEIYRIVNIDIKPGSYPNSINLKSKGVTPVAVLTDEFFDAKDIIIDNVLFAGASPDKEKLEDVDSDGDLDLILHFKTQSLQLNPTSTEAVLTAKLNDGTLIKGVDTVRIVSK
jgi:hypothetical protein